MSMTKIRSGQSSFSLLGIVRKCFLQTDVIQEKFNALNFCTNKGKPELEDYKRTEEINVAFRENNKAIRKYLASLEVVE